MTRQVRQSLFGWIIATSFQLISMCLLQRLLQNHCISAWSILFQLGLETRPMHLCLPCWLAACLPALHALWGGQVKVLNRTERTFTIRYMKDGEVELNIGRRNAAVLNRSTTQKPTPQNPMTAETTSMLPNRLLSLNQHLRIIPWNFRLCRCSLLHLAEVLFNNTGSSSFLRVPDYSIPHLWSPQ